MRCKSKILRNGYWTGKQCSRPATKLVIFGKGTDNEDVRPCCTQHAKQIAEINYGGGSPTIEDVA